MSKNTCGRLHTVPFALAAGIVCALGAALLVWSSALSDWGYPIAILLSSVYKGAVPSFLGGFIAAIWGFIDGFLTGLIFAFLYNWICCHCKKCKICK